MKKTVMVVLLSLFCSVVAGYADSLNNVPPNKDTYINQHNPDTGNGALTSLLLTTLADTTHTAILAQWDISSIPTNAVVSNVVVSFTKVATDYTANSIALSLFSPNAAWLENYSWNQVMAGSLTLLQGTTLNPLLSYPIIYTSSGEALTNLVQGWVNNPSSNRGILLVQSIDDEHYVSFMSKEGGSGPTISVTYTIPEVPILTVTPADNFNSVLYRGGTPEPPSKDYILQNTGTGTLNWTVSQAWVEGPFLVSQTSGSLGEEASTTISVLINTEYSFSESNYSDTIIFSNTNNGNGNTTRTASLLVYDSGTVPGAFNLKDPENGIHTDQFSTGCVVQWYPSTGATSYDVYFGTTNPPPYYANVTTCYHLLETPDYTTYYWNIVAKNESGSTPSSDGPFSIIKALRRIVDLNFDGQEDILWRYYGAGGRNRVWFLGNTGSESQLLAAKDTGMPAESADPANREAPKEAAIDKRETGMETDRKGKLMVLDPKDAVHTLRWRDRLKGAGDGCQTMESVDPGMAAAPILPVVIDPQLATSALNPEPSAENIEMAAATGILSGADIPAVTDTAWQIAGVGDFNNDDNIDVLWRYNGTGGRVRVWYMSGTSLISGADIASVTDLNWQIVGTGDFNKDGNVDILWRYNGSGGRVRVWFMNGINIISGADIGSVPDLNWTPVGTGDFDKDGNIDILWRYYGTGGRNRVWYMNGPDLISGADLMGVSDLNWQIAAVADYNGDGNVDVLWRYNGAGGYVYIWYLNGLSWTGTEKLSAVPDLNWKVVSR